MLLLVVLMVSSAVMALVLGVVGRRGAATVPLVAEVVMLVAMLDCHLPGLGIVPAPFWALLLGGCAMGTALFERVRGSGRRPGVDHLHALGMLLAAVFVVLGSGEAHRVAGHDHGVVLLPVVVAVVVHAAAVVWSVCGGRAPRVESVRRLSSLASVLAMGAMVAIH
jgi:hypothetical protein